MSLLIPSPPGCGGSRGLAAQRIGMRAPVGWSGKERRRVATIHRHLTHRRYATAAPRRPHAAAGTRVKPGPPPADLKGMNAPSRSSALVLLFVCLAGCAGTGPSPRGVATGPAVRAERHGHHRDHQVGLATYYATRFAGRRTASGSSYDPDRLTGAHRTFAF